MANLKILQIQYKHGTPTFFLNRSLFEGYLLSKFHLQDFHLINSFEGYLLNKFHLQDFHLINSFEGFLLNKFHLRDFCFINYHQDYFSLQLNDEKDLEESGIEPRFLGPQSSALSITPR